MKYGGHKQCVSSIARRQNCSKSGSIDGAWIVSTASDQHRSASTIKENTKFRQEKIECSSSEIVSTFGATRNVLGTTPRRAKEEQTAFGRSQRQ
jgi:hypothetical protein